MNTPTSPRLELPRRFTGWGLLTAGLLLVAAACHPGGPNPFRGGASAAGGQISIEVQNLNFNDIQVYAYRRGQRIRVGDVTGKTDRTFRIPWDVAVPIQFQVQVVGGQSCSTANLNVDPGAEVWLQVPSDVSLSACRATRR